MIEGGKQVTRAVRLLIVMFAFLTAKFTEAASAQQPDYIGLSVNDVCELGRCPPTSEQPDRESAIDFSFFAERFTVPHNLQNGDRFQIVGLLKQDNSRFCDGGSARPFSVQYLGNAGDSTTPSQDDELVVRVYHRWNWRCGGASSLRSGAFTGVWGAGISDRSFALLTGSPEDGLASLRAGPHVAPSAFSDPRQFNAPIRAGVLTIGYVFTVKFGAGSKPGAYLALNGAPSPSLDVTNGARDGRKDRPPEGMNLTGAWIGSGFPIDNGRPGAQVKIIIHQDGARVTAEEHELLLRDSRAKTEASFDGTASATGAVVEEHGRERCPTEGRITAVFALSKDGRLGGQSDATAPNCLGDVYWLANADDPTAVEAEQAWMLGTDAVRQEHYDEAFRQFQRGHELGSSASAFSLARMLDGQSQSAADSPGHARALQLYKEAAAAGFVPATHFQFCNSEKMIEAVRKLHDKKDKEMLWKVLPAGVADQIIPDIFWKLRVKDPAEVLDILVNVFDMSDDHFGCTFQLKNNLALEAPTPSNPNDHSGDAAELALNQFLELLLYANSYDVKKMTDHTCTLTWVQRTLGGRSVRTPPSPDYRATVPACW